MEKMSKKAFWLRFSLFFLFAFVIPFTFLTWRFKLFSKVTKLSIGGWGLIAIIFGAVFFIGLIKAVRKGLPFSMLSQVLEGICKVIIPILTALLIVNAMQDSIKEMYYFLCVLLFSETIAIVVNPLPQWAHENKIEFENKRTSRLLETLGILGKKEEK